MGNLGSGSTGLGCAVDDDDDEDGSGSETQDYKMVVIGARKTFMVRLEG